MRLLFVVLLALVGLVQYPLWVGKGGWFRVWELQGELAEQRSTVEGLRARNAALAAEVDDLRTGTGALEERARGDLGMMRDGEVFVQILPHNEVPPSGALPAGQAASGRPDNAAHNPSRGVIGAAPVPARSTPANPPAASARSAAPGTPSARTTPSGSTAGSRSGAAAAPARAPTSGAAPAATRATPPAAARPAAGSSGSRPRQ